MHKNLLNTPIEEITKVGKAISNPARVKILNFCAEKEHNITEIQRYLQIRFTTITTYVRQLEDAGLLKSRVQVTEKGRNVMVKSLFAATSNSILKEVSIVPRTKI